MTCSQIICTMIVAGLAILGYLYFDCQPVPEIVEISAPSEASEGSSKSLSCMVHKMSPKYSLLWSFLSDEHTSQWSIVSYGANIMLNNPTCASGKPKYDLAILDNFYDGIFLYELTVNCLTLEDTGKYRCSIPVSNTDKNKWPQKLSYMKIKAIPKPDKPENDDDDDDMSWKKFKCVLKCLGGPSAVGLSGVLALIALVTYGLPAIGFTATGVAAASIAAKLMAWYKGSIAAGSFIAILQSIGAAGIGYKAILTAMFGSSAVAAALQGRCGC